MLYRDGLTERLLPEKKTPPRWAPRGEERGVVVDVFHSVFVQMLLAKKGETRARAELEAAN